MEKYCQATEGYPRMRLLPLLFLTSCAAPKTALDNLPSLLPEPSASELKQQADERRFLNYGIPMP